MLILREIFGLARNGKRVLREFRDIAMSPSR
jgi:hypothetical protein